MQNAMQTTIRLHSHVENVLRAASTAQQPLTVKDIYEKPDVRNVAKSEQQVRDLLKSFASNKLAVQMPVAQDSSGDKRARVGFMWNPAIDDVDATAVRERMANRTRSLANQAQGGKKPSQPKVTAPLPAPIVAAVVAAVKPPQDVELVIGSVSISIGKNEVTGAVRITFLID